MACTAEDDVEPLLAAALVDRAEVHQHPAVRSRCITDAEDDDVALVALHVLQVLDEQASELVGIFADILAVQPQRECFVLRRQRIEGGLDLVLLRLGEGDHADAHAGFAGQQFADHLCDVARLGGVASPLIDAIGHRMEADGAIQQCLDAQHARVLLVRSHHTRLRVGRFDTAVRDGDQPAVVEGGIGEADQRLVPAAVMPSQQGRRKIPCGLVEQAVRVHVDGNAFAVLFDQDFVLAVAAGGEEAGRRQLHLVADDHDLARAAQRGDGFFGGDLAGLVEDHHVEQIAGQRQRVGDRERAHQPDRLEVVDDEAGFIVRQVADGTMAHALAELVLQFAPAGRVALLELLADGVELRGGQRRSTQVVGEQAMQRGADHARIGGEQVALRARDGVCATRQSHAVEACQLGRFALRTPQGFCGDRGLGRVGRSRQRAQGPPDCSVGAMHRTQQGQQIRQVIHALAQIAQQFGQRAERVGGCVHHIARVRGKGVQGVTCRDLPARGGHGVGRLLQVRDQSTQHRVRRQPLAQRCRRRQECLDVGHAVTRACHCFGIVDPLRGSLFVRQRLHDAGVAGMHGVLVERIAAAQLPPQPPPGRLQPAQCGTFHCARQRQRGLRVGRGELLRPMDGGARRLRQIRLQCSQRLARLAQGGRTAALVEQLQMTCKTFLQQAMGSIGQGRRSLQAERVIDKGLGILEEGIQAIELRLRIIERILQPRIGTLVGQQRAAQAGERMTGQPVAAEALAHVPVYAVGQRSFGIPGCKIGQPFVGGCVERRRSGQLKQSAHQPAQRRAESGRDRRHPRLERGDPLLLALQPLQ